MTNRGTNGSRNEWKQGRIRKEYPGAKGYNASGRLKALISPSEFSSFRKSHQFKNGLPFDEFPLVVSVLVEELLLALALPMQVITVDTLAELEMVARHCGWNGTLDVLKRIK